MPVTRSQRRIQNQLPYEVLGQIYTQVDRPAEFGAVNSAFREVQTDAHYEKARLRRIIEEAIRENNGRIFDHMPWPHSFKMLYKMVYEEYGCIIFIRVRTSFSHVFYGKNIKRLNFKAVVGIQSISNNPRFLPVGRFDLSHRPFSPTGMTVIDNQELLASLDEKLEQNNPVLKTDLLRALRTDLENPCTRLIVNHVTLANPRKAPVADMNYNQAFADFLASLPLLEQDDKSVLDVIDAFFDPGFAPVVHSWKYSKENAKVIDDVLEITQTFTWNYKWYWI